MSDNANKLLINLKGVYMGASGEALIAYLQSRADNALRQLTNSTVHVDLIKAQAEYKVYTEMIKLKETVRTLK